MHSPLRMSARLMLLGAAFGSLVCLAGEAAPAGEKPLVRDGALVQQPGGGVHLNHVQVDGLEGCRNALLGAGLSGGVVFLPLLDASLKAQGSDLPSGFVPLAQPHAKEGEQGRDKGAHGAADDRGKGDDVDLVHLVLLSVGLGAAVGTGTWVLLALVLMLAEWLSEARLARRTAHDLMNRPAQPQSAPLPGYPVRVEPTPSTTKEVA